MKRYPKRARPLWGAAKRRAPIRYMYGPAMVTIRGLDIDGNEVVETSELPAGSVTWTSREKFASLTAPIVFTQSKMRADFKIKVSFSDGPLPPRPGVLTFTAVAATPIHESGPRVSANGMTAGSIGARAVGHAFADGIAAGIALSHGGPLVALAAEQARESEEADARRRVLESQLGIAVGALQDEADMRRALAGGAFPPPLTQGDPRP